MEAGLLVSIDGEQYARFYNDSPGWPHPECELEAERAYRDACVAAAREASEWDFPDVDAVEAAWQAREEARRQAEMIVTSAQLFNDPRFDDFDPPATQFIYRVGHEVEASQTRGRVHAFEIAKQEWWDLADVGLDDDEEIRRLFMRPWADAVAVWSNGPLEPMLCPPRPLDQFSPAQWRAVLANQRGAEHSFESVEAAEADFNRRLGGWYAAWDCRDEHQAVIGRGFRWWRPLGDIVRLVAEYGNRWVWHDEEAGGNMTKLPALPRARSRRLITVQREQLEWLWPGRVPLGKLTLLAGDPGLGKSFVTLDMAARVSRGKAWPDLPLLSQSPAGVILLNAEDDLGDTIAPRLDQAGADDSRIVAVDGVTIQNRARHFSLETDLATLDVLLVENPDTRLIVIDPIAAYCGKVDSHKNTDVRGLLAPLAELASRREVAIVAVTHLSKTGGSKAVYRAMGSLAFAAAARAVWVITKAGDDPQRRLFLPAKLNLARDPNGLAYRIVEGRVEWEMGPVRLHADDAFAAEAAASTGVGPGRRDAERREAIGWLQKELAGGPVPASEIIDSGEQCGFNKRTVQRAFEKLGGVRKKDSFGGPWKWGLPDQDDAEGDNEDDTNPTSF